jgi:hypothetical protein
MQNVWLQSAQAKKLMQEIDTIAMDIWSQDGTLGDLFSALNDDHTDLLFSMKIKEFSIDPTDNSCSITLNPS